MTSKFSSALPLVLYSHSNKLNIIITHIYKTTLLTLINITDFQKLLIQSPLQLQSNNHQQLCIMYMYIHTISILTVSKAVKVAKNSPIQCIQYYMASLCTSCCHVRGNSRRLCLTVCHFYSHHHRKWLQIASTMYPHRN